MVKNKFRQVDYRPKKSSCMRKFIVCMMPGTAFVR